MSVASLTFDTHELVKNLIASGFREEQAEAITKGVLRAHEIANLATKSDIQQLDTKIDKVSAELNAKIDKVSAALDAKIDRVDAKIDREIAEVKAILKVHEWQLRLIMAGIGAIFVAVMVPLLRPFFGG